MGTTDVHLPCAISFLFMQFSAKILLNNRLEFPLPRLASPLPLVKFWTMTTMKYIFVISDVVSNKFGTHSDDKNLWISEPYLGILEKFQCSLALAYIKIIVLYYFWVNCIDYLFMLQNIFSHRLHCKIESEFSNPYDKAELHAVPPLWFWFLFWKNPFASLYFIFCQGFKDKIVHN